MISDDSFLQTILAHSNDAGPRLVYADWLEERGECQRAELIRLQCLGGPEQRIRELLKSYGRQWAGTIDRHAYSYAFRRGFVEEVAVEARVLVDHAEEIFARAPLSLLRIIRPRAVLPELAGLPWLGRLRALHLTNCNIGDDGAALVALCPYLLRLESLRIGSNAIGDRGVEYFADSPYLNDLQSLVLHGNLIGDAGAHVLATAGGLSGLQSLDLSENHIGDSGAAALAGSARFACLTRLDLSHQFKGWSPVLAQRGRPHPIQLRHQKALKERFGADACAF